MVKKQVADLPAIVSKDEAYQNAIKNSDARNARVESDRATMQAILDSMSTTIELYKAVNENLALCRWIQDMVFANTYQTSPPTLFLRASLSVMIPLEVDTIAIPKPFITLGISLLFE